jgi:hypothetical protein
LGCGFAGALVAFGFAFDGTDIDVLGMGAAGTGVVAAAGFLFFWLAVEES